MAIENIDQHGEGTVEPVDDLLRGARLRAGGEAAEIDEHDGDAAEVAGRARPLRHQPLHHLRRDVLAEQVRYAVARGGSGNARGKLTAQLRADGTGEHAADQDD